MAHAGPRMRVYGPPGPMRPPPVPHGAKPHDAIGPIVVPNFTEEGVANIHCTSGDGAAYRGDLNTTIGGLQCQRWDHQVPHEHDIARAKYWNHNFCRNPNGRKRPWCFTQDVEVEFQYCDIPICATPNDLETDLFINKGFTYKGNVTTTLSKLTCKTSIKKSYTLQNCLLDLEDNGLMYSGTVDTTRSGKKCKMWNRADLHSEVKYAELYGPQVRNYCRNPDNSPEPWCFVGRDADVREACDIPLCTPDTMQLYTGSRLNVCSRWVHDEIEIPWCYVDQFDPLYDFSTVIAAEPCLFDDLLPRFL